MRARQRFAFLATQMFLRVRVYVCMYVFLSLYLCIYVYMIVYMIRALVYVCMWASYISLARDEICRRTEHPRFVLALSSSLSSSYPLNAKSALIYCFGGVHRNKVRQRVSLVYSPIHRL